MSKALTVTVWLPTNS